jgi:hypothetical protein
MYMAGNRNMRLHDDDFNLRVVIDMHVRCVCGRSTGTAWSARSADQRKPNVKIEARPPSLSLLRHSNKDTVTVTVGANLRRRTELRDHDEEIMRAAAQSAGLLNRTGARCPGSESVPQCHSG